ncbi:MAG: transcription termination factor NusA [Candidatus Omnitrophota bacterium]
MNDQLLSVLEHIERERGIDKELLFKAIESALVSAAKKIVGKKEAEVVVTVDRASGEIKIFNGEEEIRSAEFGRIAAQTAKQVIIQRIREAERDVIFEDYKKKIGTITNGSVHRFERGDIIIDLGKTEGVLPRSQQCSRERYKQGDRVRVYVLEVNRSAHGPEIVLSRASAGFVKKLFEMEVPEITEGIVEVRAIARDAGDRTKIAVWSKDDKIDPVGACVGMRGSRVKDVVRELQGERIDIVRWQDDIREYAKSALNPAQVAEMKIDSENKKVAVIVEDDQLSIAIGRHGQNVRLASKLIGWEIDISGKEASKKMKDEKVKKPGKASKKEAGALIDVPLSDIDGISLKIQSVLKEAGFDGALSLMKATEKQLLALPGVGKKTVERIIVSIRSLKKSTTKEESTEGAS